MYSHHDLIALETPEPAKPLAEPSHLSSPIKLIDRTVTRVVDYETVRHVPRDEIRAIMEEVAADMRLEHRQRRMAAAGRRGGGGGGARAGRCDVMLVAAGWGSESDTLQL